mgnify:CR=1 FL=1
MQLLQGAQELFPALVRAMDAARTSVLLETYIFDTTGAGADIARALARAAARSGRGGAGCVQAANCEVVGQCVAVVPWALLAAEATRWAPAALATGASAACDAAATLGL